ncbi:hypothetical protein SAMN04488057_10775 [Cyclobacterium lianum]|uniref:Uncharacterized protein n=1 Tax=Cyclobacterium lianum TaxID=388280 RepID=A0A1M7P6M3_9BACT|nr:hypothetical protein [Cyclobacterium lianum]SHN12334.1 hypothetical protein SAMN04488057_10775 [Cyclobacterium lianum]
MHLKSDDIIRLEIEYTTGEVPPPFSHVFKLKMSFGKNFVNTQFDIHYTGREDLSPEEIIDEGFTMADDYSYKGEIPKLWENVFKKLYSASKWSNQKTLGEKGGIKILAKDTHGKITRDIPLNQEDWYLTCQDFIQAIYEISKKEAPLGIRFKSIGQEGLADIELLYRFSIRKVEAKVNDQVKPLEWDEGRSLASLIFIPDYDYTLASEDQPIETGNYLDCGDGLWHNFNTGIINLDPEFDAKGKILEAFRNLSS